MLNVFETGTSLGITIAYVRRLKRFGVGVGCIQLTGLPIGRIARTEMTNRTKPNQPA